MKDQSKKRVDITFDKQDDFRSDVTWGCPYFEIIIHQSLLGIHRSSFIVSHNTYVSSSKSVSRRVFVVPRKAFLIRVDESLLAALQAWADADLRSLNGQIEYVLRDALIRQNRIAAANTTSNSAKETSEASNDSPPLITN
jgi:hypothetical protein